MDYFYDYDIQPPLYDDDEKVFFKMSEKSFSDTWMNCVQPSITQIISYIQNLLLWNIICRIGWVIFRDVNFLQSIAVHIVSIICGLVILVQTIGTSTLYICAFVLISYTMLFILHSLKITRVGHTFGVTCLIGLALCELMQTDTKIWHQIRGTQMVASMKAISMSFDVDAKKIDKFPNIFAYMGYLLCPANSVLGPWIAFDEYKSVFTHGPKYDIKWIFWTITNTIAAIFFLCLSNCFVGMLMSDYSWKWLVAYRDALAFRCSHYFISFLSQATMCVSGLVHHTPGEKSYIFGHFVSKPLVIEFPRSLVQVVINWNIPMHRWLKDYVFRKMKIYGTAIAIFTTYFASSLLHGLNLQLYAVLLSLGIYTFVEYRLRHKIANIFNACILAQNCKHRNCLHEHKWNSLLVLFVNIIFSFLSIAHLAYLGVMFEASTTIQEEGYSIYHTLSKWRNLNFISHWIILFSYAFYLLI